MARRGLLALVIGLALVSVIATGRAATVWRSEVSLWHQAVILAPLKLRPRINYATALALEGRQSEANAQMRLAAQLALAPGVPTHDRLDALTALAAWTGDYSPRADASGFVYEDRTWLLATRAWPSLWARRWLSRATLWVQWRAMDAPRVAPVRRLNILLHAGVMGLLGLLLTRLLPASRLGVMAGVTLLAVHPLTIETMMTLTGRAELLMALGVLGACVAVVRLTGWRRVVVIAVCLFAAGAAKESAIVAIALVPVVWRSVCASRAARGAVSLGVVGLVAACVLGRHAGEIAGATVSGGAWGLAQASAAVRLVGLSVFPMGQTIDFDYDRVPGPFRVAALGVLCAVAVWAVATWRRAGLLGVGVAWILIAILPRLIVRTPRSYFNEHQFYLALIGVGVVVAALVARAELWAIRRDRYVC